MFPSFAKKTTYESAGFVTLKSRIGIRSFFLWGACLLCGCAVESFCFGICWTWFVVGIFSMMVAIVRCVMRRSGFVVALLVSVFCAGGWLVGVEERTLLLNDRIEQDQLLDRVFWFQGIVEQFFSKTSIRSSFALRLESFAHNPFARWVRTSGTILCVVHNPSESIEQGAAIRVPLRLRFPRYYANPGARDRMAQLARVNIRFQGSAEGSSVLVFSRGDPSSLQALCYQLRQRLLKWLKYNLKEKDAFALISALLLGEKSFASEELRKVFQKTGTSHLLAISGLHLGLLASILVSIFTRILCQIGFFWIFPQCFAMLISIPCLVFYVFLSGCAVSTVRAIVMLSLYSFALLLRRGHESLQIFSFTAGLFLVFDPLVMHDIGFQLSFMAVFVLIVWFHFSKRSIDIDRKKGFLNQSRGTVFASLMIVVFTLPMTLSFSRFVNVLSPFLNVIAIPLCGYFCVGLGLFALCFWLISSYASSLMLSLCGCFAGFLIDFLSFFAAQTWSIFEFSSMTIVEAWVYFGLIAIFFLRSFFQISSGISVFFGIALLVIPICTGMEGSRRLELHFIDVGQGDSTLVRFPNGQTMLVDAGGEPFLPIDVGKRSILPYIRSLRLSFLDFVVLSHPHPDHFGGLLSVMGEIPAKEFWSNGQRSHHEKYVKLNSYLEASPILKRFFFHPQVSWIGDVKVEIMHPFPGPFEGKTYYWGLHANDNSLVIRLTYKDVRILLTGDIEKRGEELLTEKWKDLRADVIKVPHHGSRTSSTALFLDRVRPDHAVFCVGRSNGFGFPHAEVLERYEARQIKMWRTDRHGRVLLKTDGHSIEFSTHLHSFDRHSQFDSK